MWTVVALLFLIAAFMFLCFWLIGKVSMKLELVVALDVFMMALLLAAWLPDLWLLNPLLALDDLLVIAGIMLMSIYRLIDAKKAQDREI